MGPGVGSLCIVVARLTLAAVLLTACDAPPELGTLAASQALAQPTPAVVPGDIPIPEPTPARVSATVGGLPGGLAANIEALIATSPGVARAGIIVKDSAAGDAVRIDPDRQFEAASLYKLFLLWAVQDAIAAGDLADDTPLTLSAATDDSADDGYTLGDYGDTVTVAEARRLMIVASNNTAAWLLVEALGGWAAIERPLRDRGFDYTETSPALLTTPRDVTRLLEGIVDGTLDPHLDTDDYALMLGLLRDQQLNAYLSPGLSPGAVFAHKTGNVPGVLHDAGILFLPDGRTLYLVVLTEGDYQAGLAFMRRVGQLVTAEPNP